MFGTAPSKLRRMNDQRLLLSRERNSIHMLAIECPLSTEVQPTLEKGCVAGHEGIYASTVTACYSNPWPIFQFFNRHSLSTCFFFLFLEFLFVQHAVRLQVVKSKRLSRVVLRTHKIAAIEVTF
ncbi:unnamed protein product [Haemonchus placei]|uniref:Uncharacterized protein n=1 Tax=Haemonchus placei TaxID=6290 RepID=A0A0N4VS10_HAEPC|nr:unnamed protein product [Haemonchus placei]